MASVEISGLQVRIQLTFYRAPHNWLRSRARVGASLATQRNI